MKKYLEIKASSLLDGSTKIEFPGNWNDMSNQERIYYVKNRAGYEIIDQITADINGNTSTVADDVELGGVSDLVNWRVVCMDNSRMLLNEIANKSDIEIAIWNGFADEQS